MIGLYKMVCSNCDTVEHFTSVPLEWRCDACDGMNGYSNKGLVNRTSLEEIYTAAADTSESDRLRKELVELKAKPNDAGENTEISVDNINPTHYTSFIIAPNEYITANKLEWEVGNVIKYISRYKLKNGLEDLRKAQKYLELLIDREYYQNGGK